MTENKPKKKLGRAFLPEGEKKGGINMQIEKWKRDKHGYATLKKVGEDAVDLYCKKNK